MSNYYDPEDTRQAAILLTSVAEKYRGNNNFEYDLVDICRQALADQGRKQYLKPWQISRHSHDRISRRIPIAS